MIHVGCFKDTYYILDVESGSLHEVDEPTFQIAALIEQGITERDEIIRRLSIDPALAEEILDELSELKQAQLFDSQSVAQDAAPQFPKPVVKAMCRISRTTATFAALIALLQKEAIWGSAG